MADLPTDSQAAPADATSTAASPAVAPQSQAAAPEASTAPATSIEAKPVEGQEAKPGEKLDDAAKPAEVTYEFKVPEGFDPNTEGMNELKATAKELGLTPEQAQRIADLGVKQAQGFAAQLADQQKTLTAQWAEETTTDKEIGGDKLPENLGVAKKALDTFGTKELKTLLNQSGLGNHPEIVRFMVKAGKAISEDGKLVTGSAAQADRAAMPIENRLYPNQK